MHSARCAVCPTSAVLVCMCAQNWLAGLVWTWEHATGPFASETWSYTYPIAPLVADLLQYLRTHATPTIAPTSCVDIAGRTQQLLLHVLITPVADNALIAPQLQQLHRRFGAKLTDGSTEPQVSPAFVAAVCCVLRPHSRAAGTDKQAQGCAGEGLKPEGLSLACLPAC